jgi:ribonuclease R
MPERYADAIMNYLASRDYQPLKPPQLARQMGVADSEYGSFREAIKQLRDAGRVVLGSGNALTLPEIARYVVGHFRLNQRGFGFVIPETPNSHGDLFIPPDGTGGAMTGDRVRAEVRKDRRRGKKMLSGQIVSILERGRNRFVGTLEHTGEMWFVLPEGQTFTSPIVVRDLPTHATTGPDGAPVAAGPGKGRKVVVEITRFPSESGDLPEGVIVETLGEPGDADVETVAVIRAHGIPDEFPPEAVEDARQAVDGFQADRRDGREDLTDLTICTIDPPTARDFDDAISISDAGDGEIVLGVHIADVSHFVREGSCLDEEARKRGNSCYFPTRVVPMLPETLSNGVCSLQEGVERYCKSVFIRYDGKANVRGTKVCESVIRSAKRLTYAEAQDICDGKIGGYDRKIVELVQSMRDLARSIEARRREDGMLHLDLPEGELLLDEEGKKVVDVVPEDQAYTHTIIEMFMVEANEAVARVLDAKGRAFLRRIHPPPETEGKSGPGLTPFLRACGHKIPKDPSRKDLQAILEAVQGKPESFPVNLAILKTFQQAEYSPMNVEHYALASGQYCHFTSPIRRYPDLTVHREIEKYCRNLLDRDEPQDLSELTRLGQDCTATERRAEAAESELREVLVLQLLEDRVGEVFDGTITGLTNFGIFVQSPRYLVEGLVRLEDLGDDWWDVNTRYGTVKGEATGKTFRMGGVITVRIAGVDVPRRQLNLVPEEPTKTGKKKAKGKGGKKRSSSKGGRRRKKKS